MPGLDLSQVSSNWRKLQEKLQTEKQQQQRKPQLDSGVTGVKGIKRKRSERAEQATRSHSYKEARTSLPSTSPQATKLRRISSKMDALTSTLSTSTPHTTLLEDHDISRADIAAAYGTETISHPRHGSKPDLTAALARKHTDKLNGGLHPAHQAGKYIALDCEMVGTGAAPDFPDNVLARVSAVNFHGEQLYDSYVAPPASITIRDYRTQYSGIRPQHVLVSNGARSFAQVQAEVAALLRGRVLVGHALRNDLRVLVLTHPAGDVRDTSRYGPWREASGGRAPALRVLAERELGWEIQSGEHSSIEDARATMMLFRKVKHNLETEVRTKGGPSVVDGRGKGSKGGKQTMPAPLEEEEFDDEDEEDEDEVSDENDDMPLGDRSGGAARAKKKRSSKKKKKRTKRK